LWQWVRKRHASATSVCAGERYDLDPCGYAIVVELSDSVDEIETKSGVPT